MLRTAIWMTYCAGYLTACGADSVGEATEGGEFAGDESEAPPNGSEAPVSGESTCSLLDASSCNEGSACTPSSHGVRLCEDHAVLEVGEGCAASEKERCVAGALCLDIGHKPALCVEVCDPMSPQCLSGTCSRWFEIDGESIGWCDDGE